MKPLNLGKNIIIPKSSRNKIKNGGQANYQKSTFSTKLKQSPRILIQNKFNN